MNKEARDTMLKNFYKMNQEGDNRIDFHQDRGQVWKRRADKVQYFTNDWFIPFAGCVVLVQFAFSNAPGAVSAFWKKAIFLFGLSTAASILQQDCERRAEENDYANKAWKQFNRDLESRIKKTEAGQMHDGELISQQFAFMNRAGALRHYTTTPGGLYGRNVPVALVGEPEDD